MGIVRVIGLGNEWSGDDAVGLIAAQKLREKNIPDIEVRVTDVPDWEMFEKLVSDDVLIFIDACDGGGEAGAIYQLHSDEIMERGVRHCSSHGLGLSHWLSMAEVLGKKTGRILIYAIEIGDVTMGSGLSKKVENAIPKVLNMIEKKIAGLSMETAHA
ncbi:MAG: hydrogenase maturation protease [Mariprofundaceae bacterium]